MNFVDRQIAKNLKNPAFRKEWEDSELEYQLARNIIQRRKKMGLTQKEIAERLRTKQSVVSRIENGSQNVTLGSLKAIAKVLETDVNSLLAKETKKERYRLIKH